LEFKFPAIIDRYASNEATDVWLVAVAGAARLDYLSRAGHFLLLLFVKTGGKFKF
jgi:hypothetical protein